MIESTAGGKSHLQAVHVAPPDVPPGRRDFHTVVLIRPIVPSPALTFRRGTIAA
jgi:hypothetical protein